MNIVKGCVVFLSVFSSLIVSADDVNVESQVSSPTVDLLEKLIIDNTIIGFSWISQPLNKILLIKNGKNQCAIKYLSFSRGHDAKENTVFKAGSESFYAEAEYIVLPEGKFKQLKLTLLPSSGIGRLILYSPSHNYIHCGKGDLSWQYPTSTMLWSTDVETALAATSFEDFTQINFEDPKLQWFHYQEGRKIILQPNPAH